MDPNGISTRSITPSNCIWNFVAWIEGMIERKLHRTRNSSGDEIANVNFFYDDIVHVLQNTVDLCMNSATDRRGYVLERTFTKFSEITQYNGHYAVQGHRFWYHSKAHMRLPISH